ncbi:hypothetical protein KHP62_00670 [Rhodobacteraceae bacterium NNCM2]|nr:hypothetical protein [Coraliihabitans acroporae]
MGFFSYLRRETANSTLGRNNVPGQSGLADRADIGQVFQIAAMACSAGLYGDN